MNTNHETILDVAGMRCGSCVRRVCNALGGLPGVVSVDVRLADGKAHVRHDPAQSSVDSLIAALHGAGHGSSLAAAA